MGHYAIGMFEQQVGYLLFTLTKINIKFTSSRRIWIQTSSCCNSKVLLLYSADPQNSKGFRLLELLWKCKMKTHTCLNCFVWVKRCLRYSLKKLIKSNI